MIFECTGDFYRLHESTIENAKVSKLLPTVDKGETSKFAGKSLTEINVNGKYKRSNASLRWLKTVSSSKILMGHF